MGSFDTWKLKLYPQYFHWNLHEWPLKNMPGFILCERAIYHIVLHLGRRLMHPLSSMNIFSIHLFLPRLFLIPKYNVHNISENISSSEQSSLYLTKFWDLMPLIIPMTIISGYFKMIISGCFQFIPIPIPWPHSNKGDSGKQLPVRLNQWEATMYRRCELFKMSNKGTWWSYSRHKSALTWNQLHARYDI